MAHNPAPLGIIEHDTVTVHVATTCPAFVNGGGAFVTLAEAVQDPDLEFCGLCAERHGGPAVWPVLIPSGVS